MSNEGIGFRTGMADASGTTAWKYDTRGRLVQETKSIIGHTSFVTSWAYNAADRVTSMTYPSGKVVDMTYHPQGQVTSVDGDDTYLSSAVYDATGRPGVLTLDGTAITQTYTYFAWNAQNGLGRLQEILVKSGTTTRQNLQYDNAAGNGPGYDSVGNILRIENVQDGDVQTFTYDDLHRLSTAASTPGTNGYYPSETYEYDVRNRAKSP